VEKTGGGVEGHKGQEKGKVTGAVVGGLYYVACGGFLR